MIRDRLIVCIASSWDYDPTSKHHLMRILSRENQVLWVNYHGTRRPTVSAADFRAAWSAIRRIAAGSQRVAPSIVQTTPLVIPGASTRPLKHLHERAVIAQIRSAIREMDPRRKRPLQVWSFAPDVPYLCGAFSEECFVYYCVDEYREFEGVDAKRIAKAEDELLARADLVVTTSDALYETKRAHRPDVVLVPHGVDYDRFAETWRNPPQKPADLAEIPRPILGFFGMIHHWIDVDLIAAAARLRPHYSFVMIGERGIPTPQLDRLLNVYLLGRRPFESLPAYCAGFDAALMPFVRSRMTRSVNPIKMYEYLAAGLPIVSTSLPEARRFQGPIRFGDTPDQFVAACDAALEGVDACDRRAAISAHVHDQTWESRVEELSAIILGRVNRVVSQSVGEWERSAVRATNRHEHEVAAQPLSR